jgi:capsular exopolysaccharide synthesis family protein
MENIEDILHAIDSQEKSETRNFFIRYLKKWPWFIAFSVTGIILGYLLFSYSPSNYEVSSRLLVKNEDKVLSNLLSFDSPSMNRESSLNIESQVGILQSYSLFNEALRNLNWETSWYKKEFLYKKELFNSNMFQLSVPTNASNAKNVLIEITVLSDSQFLLKAEGETYKNGYQQFIETEETVNFGVPYSNDFFNFTLEKGQAGIDEVYYLMFNNIQTLTSQYLKKTKVFQENINSDIITISIQGENTQKEAEFINELINVFIQFGIDKKSINSENSIKFIDEQLERIQGSLSAAENRYTNFRRNNQAINLGQEAQLVYSNLEEIENEMYLTELQINYYRELLQYLDDSQKIEEMVNPSVIGITDTNLSAMLTQLAELYNRREVLTLSVQEDNPSIIAIDREINITRDRLEETIRNQVRTTESKMKSMNERYNEIQNRMRRLPETERQMIGIQREFDLNNELYTYMMQKKAEASITKASIVPEVQVMDPAVPEAASYIGPNLMIYIFGGFTGGIIVPFIFITLLIFFNNKIETIQEVEKKSKIPVLEGIIKHKFKTLLPVIQHPRSGIAESFRGLKTNINTLVDAQGAKVVSINSLIPGEGKSFVSANLAAVLSKTNKKILLIGADLHKPTLHEFLKVKKSIGLNDFLNESKNMEEIITSTSIPNLSFIQTGNPDDNPSDLLDGSKFEKLITHTRNIFDYIIIDNAPLLLIPDAILTSQFSDLSLFILRANYSHKAQIKQINKIVDFNKIQRSALILNDTPESGYGYGYGYRKKYWKKGYGVPKV